MSETTIELASIEDAEALKDISVNAFTSDFKQYGSFPPGIESVEWHVSQINKGHYYKINYNSDLAGGICLLLKDETHIEIKYFFIAESFQNKKIGSLVMELIENQYKGVTSWSLVTPFKAYRNHHFYEKLGYVKSGESKPDPNNDFVVYEYIKNNT